MAEPLAGPDIRVAVVASLEPGQWREWDLRLPAGGTVRDALQACALDDRDARFTCGIWGRVVEPTHPLRDLDRVEWCRALVVDPKVARRERFARQGARTAGLFAGRRPGAKAGY